jgi:hypothetical protein
VTLDGTSFGARTTTGVLADQTSTAVAPIRGYYVVRVPPTSAALLTVALK